MTQSINPEISLSGYRNQPHGLPMAFGMPTYSRSLQSKARIPFLRAEHSKDLRGGVKEKDHYCRVSHFGPARLWGHLPRG